MLTPETAYAGAPSVIREISAVTAMATELSTLRHRALFLTPPTVPAAADREFWLRKAALLDRIALQEGAPEAILLAANAARRLAEFDRERPDLVTGPLGPNAIEWDISHRPYVRQEYAAWRRAGAQ